MSKEAPVLEALLKSLTEIVRDHEKRIRWLERGAFMALGVVVVVKFLIK